VKRQLHHWETERASLRKQLKETPNTEANEERHKYLQRVGSESLIPYDKKNRGDKNFDDKNFNDLIP